MLKWLQPICYTALLLHSDLSRHLGSTTPQPLSWSTTLLMIIHGDTTSIRRYAPGSLCQGYLAPQSSWLTSSNTGETQLRTTWHPCQRSIWSSNFRSFLAYVQGLSRDVFCTRWYYTTHYTATVLLWQCTCSHCSVQTYHHPYSHTFTHIMPHSVI